MSDNEIERVTKEILGDSKSTHAKALVFMAISIDKLAESISINQQKNEDKFKKLGIWFFFFDNPKWLWAFVIAVLAAFGINETSIHFIKNIFK